MNQHIHVTRLSGSLLLNHTSKELATHINQQIHISFFDITFCASFHVVQSFFIGGGRNPSSILAGFDKETLATAFNVR